MAEEPVLESPSATLTQEPVPEPEPLSTPTEFQDQREDTLPPEVEVFVRRTALEMILQEKNFDRPTKLNVESKVTPSPRQSLYEKTWHPAHKTPIETIHREIDRLKLRGYKPAGQWLRLHFKPQKVGRRIVIPPNILAKRIVYETEGGFVIEVTYREGAETRKTFFTIDSTGGRTKALEKVQSGKYALATNFSDDKVASMGAPKKGASLPYPPGKILTFPITNQFDVQEIEGIGDVYARRLHELGIHTTDQLRLMNATVIANNLGTAPATVEAWQQMSELLLVEGIGKQSAEVLVRAGVAGIDALKKEKPKALAVRANAVNTAHKVRIMRRGLQPKTTFSMIRKARAMKKSMQPFPVVEI
jgi:predicted flap endonuclease-1-like 5' DNA nuclease